MDQKKVGSFLKELRKEKGITQEQLAEKLNVSGRSVSRWETGNNMPDISLLVEIADFYDVDVRELIEGERKSEMMNNEVRDVANKMADYANNEKGRLFKVIRVIGIVGVLLLAIAIVFQTGLYEKELGNFIALVFSFLAFVVMIIMTLYVNGVLQKIKKNKALTIGLITLISIVSVVVVKCVLMFTVLFMIVIFETLAPTKKGTDGYDKEAMVSKYSSEFNSGFYLFPENLDKSVDDEYAYSAKTGLFDTDGYFILKVQYNEEDYKAEVDRMSDVSCKIDFDNNQSYTNYVYQDDTMYNYPAIIAMDGYDNAYEYALLDEEDLTIIYVALSYPESVNLIKYKDYLKKDLSAYIIPGSSLENFSLYSHRFPGEDAWIGAY